MDNSEKITSKAAGTAKIKAEFIVQDHVRQLNLNFVADKDKRKVKDGKREDCTDEPLKKKLKGQNRHRPREQRIPKSDKLCFKMGIEGFCPYGDGCCYSHDIVSYLAAKPPDISDSCYLYEIFGKCPYSFSCRFASVHTKDGQNVVNEDIVNKHKGTEFYRNGLQKETQQSLRNRNYDFTKSNKAVKAFEAMKPSPTQYLNPANDKVSVESTKEVSDLTEKNMNSQSDNPAQLESKCQIKIADEERLNNESPTQYLNPANDNVSVESTKEVSDLTEKNMNSQSDNPAQLESKCQIKIEGKERLNNESCLDAAKSIGSIIVDNMISNNPAALKKVNFRDKLYLAPLTTVGNLPFRRICKEFGADITCSEMAMSLSLLQGQRSEWALLKRHHTEDIFGIQLCGAHPDVMTRCSQLLSETTSFDFLDLNLGCPLEMVYKKGAGCGLMNRLKKLEGIIYAVTSVIDVPLTLKMRTGIYGSVNIAHNVIDKIHQWGDRISLVTIHGRSREQRYTRSANWEYINSCNKLADPIPLFGNGDVLTFEDYNKYRKENDVAGAMIARGALIKPWIFKEIKEQRHWDISSPERLEILRNYSNYGLEHWGSDTEGVEKTRRFLLEWLSFLYRYIPVGLLECPPQRINERPPPYVGRNDLETLMASPSCNDWVKISEMLLGPVPENFVFLPKHKANAYQ